MNGGGRNSSRVSCLTRQFGSLSRKGLSRKGGRVSNVPSTGWRRRRRKRLASPIDRLGYPRISVITAWKVADYRGRPEVEWAIVRRRRASTRWKVGCIAWPRWSVSRFGLNNSTILIYRLELEGRYSSTFAGRRLSFVEIWIWPVVNDAACLKGRKLRKWAERKKIGSNEAVGECLKGYVVVEGNWYDDRCGVVKLFEGQRWR